MNKNLQREAFEVFVRSGASPVPPSEVDRPLADGTYRTSAANAGWAFWQAAQAAIPPQHAELPPSALWAGHRVSDRFSQHRFSDSDQRELARLMRHPFPNGHELRARLLAGETITLEGHELKLDAKQSLEAQEEVISIRNSSGIQCMLLYPTIGVLQAFVETIRSGRQFE
jgi:hypothetical protein